MYNKLLFLFLLETESVRGYSDIDMYPHSCVYILLRIASFLYLRNKTVTKSLLISWEIGQGGPLHSVKDRKERHFSIAEEIYLGGELIAKI